MFIKNISAKLPVPCCINEGCVDQMRADADTTVTSEERSLGSRSEVGPILKADDRKGSFRKFTTVVYNGGSFTNLSRSSSSSVDGC